MEDFTNKELCRSCALSHTPTEMEFVDLFAPPVELQHEVEMIKSQMESWQLLTTNNEGVPRCICARCFNNFCNVEAFKQECQLAQKKILGSLSEADQAIGKHGLVDVRMAVVGAQSQSVDSPQSLQVARENIETFVVDNTRGVVPNAPASSTTATIPTSEAPLINNIMNISDLPAFDAAVLFEPTVVGDAESLGFTVLSDTPSSGAVTTDNCSKESTHSFNVQKVTEQFGKSQQMESGVTDLMSQDLEDLLQSNIISKPKPQEESGGVIRKYIKQPVTHVTPLQVPAASATYVRPQHNVQANGSTLNGHISSTTTTGEPTMNDVSMEVDFEIDLPPTRLSNNPLACQYCYCPPWGPVSHLIYKDEDELSEHFLCDHDPNYPYSCPKCPSVFDEPKARDQHVKSAHRYCKFCKKMLRGPMEAHLYNCTYVSDWRCADCGEEFPQITLSEFKIHQRAHEVEKLQCNFCGRSFKSRANLEVHKKAHAPRDASCKLCSKVLPSGYDLQLHVSQCHRKKFPVRCPICNQGFTSLAFMQRHLRHIHGGKTDKLVNGSRKSPSVSHAHIRSTEGQGENELYFCQECPKRFSRQTDLELHLLSHDYTLSSNNIKEHVRTNSYKCEKCNKRFGLLKELRNHMLFHTQLSQKCPELDCDYVAQNSQQLNNHLRAIHHRLKCELCNKQLARNQLAVHMRNAHHSEMKIETATTSTNSSSTKSFTSPTSSLENYNINANKNTANSKLIEFFKGNDDENNNPQRSPTSTSFARARTAKGNDKVQVQFIHGEPSSNDVAVDGDYSDNKSVVPDEIMSESFFADPFLEPDNEIVIT